MELYSVLVTGANRGIGLEFVRQITRLNPPPKHVFATYRSSQNLENLESIRDSCAANCSVHLLKVDVTNINEVQSAKAFIEHVVKENGLTMLINNAGVAEVKAFPDITVENLNHHFSTNTVGPILVTQAMYPLLKASAARKEGPGMSYSRAGILSISSMAGSIEGTGKIFPDLVVPAYKISKAGLNMIMKIISINVEPDNILVVNMCPGYVKTDMTRGTGEMETKESIEAILATISKLDENHTGTYVDRYGKPYQF